MSSLLSSSAAASAEAGTRSWTVSLYDSAPSVPRYGVGESEASTAAPASSAQKLPLWSLWCGNCRSGACGVEIVAVEPAMRAPLRLFLQLALMPDFKAGSVKGCGCALLIAQPHPFTIRAKIFGHTRSHASATTPRQARCPRGLDHPSQMPRRVRVSLPRPRTTSGVWSRGKIKLHCTGLARVAALRVHEGSHAVAISRSLFPTAARVNDSGGGWVQGPASSSYAVMFYGLVVKLNFIALDLRASKEA
jgi:hypothetical protein